MSPEVPLAVRMPPSGSSLPVFRGLVGAMGTTRAVPVEWLGMAMVCSAQRSTECQAEQNVGVLDVVTLSDAGILPSE